MKKTILALFLASTLSAQSTIQPEINISHFGGINFRADHEISKLELGIQTTPNQKYWILDEGHATVMLINDRYALFSKQNGNNGNTKTSILVGGTFTKAIDKYVGIEYGYFLGATTEKQAQVVEVYKIALTMRNFWFNPSINYERINGANYLGLGLRILPKKIFK